ncbi:MAG: cytochrome b/b6 domain-containing protein, partial [Candidatus Saccharimonadales bacterium]
MAYNKIKRMTAFMRINHWVVAICMVAAVITGLYIAHPYYQSMIAEDSAYTFVMAWNRWIH